jgi:hypothetical protein
MSEVVTVPITEALFGARREAPPRRQYHVDPTMDYEVRWTRPPGARGRCRARLTDDQQAVVLEVSDLPAGVSVQDIRWQPVFLTGQDGVAKLQAVRAHRLSPAG